MDSSHVLTGEVSTCLLTPLYRGDLERFRLLRESIEACDIQLAHVVVVHTEDRNLIDPFIQRHDVTVLTTADVLPAWLERRRVARQLPWTKPARWLCRHPMAGWDVQMYTKILAANYCNFETIVCVDADMAFVRRVDAADFHSGGRTLLFRLTTGLDIEMVEWVGRSMRFLGINPCGMEPRRYTYSPFPMNRSILKDLYAFIESKTSRPWLEAMVKQPWITECATYGVYAEHVDKLHRVMPVVPSLAGWCWWPEEAADISSAITTICQDRNVKVIGVQSNLKRDVGSYADAVRRQWTREHG